MDNNKKQYRITQDENDYILTSELNINNLRITLQEINKNNPLIYKGDFSLLDLKRINEVFYTTPTIQDALMVINNIIEEQKVNIEKKQNYINILLFLHEENQNEDNYFTLKCDLFNSQNLQRSYSSNVIYSSNGPVEITYSPPRRLPDMHVKLPTIHTRLPTIHTNVIDDENNQNNESTPSTSHITSYFTPQRDNIIHNQILTPLRNKEIKSQTTAISTQQYYNYKSPKREQIQYIIPGSPSTGVYNYSAVSSKNNRNNSSQNNIIQTTMLDNSFQQNPNESSSTMNSSEDKIQISALQKETNKIKLDHEFLKKKTYELINEVQLLRNQIQILNNENQNLRKNKGISPSESQIHEIIFLKNEVKRLSDELSNKKMKENSEFERYKQIKEEEINIYKLRIENYKLLNLQKEKEINELKLKLSNSNMIEKTQYIQDSCLEIVKGEIIHNNNELEFLTKKICNKKKMTLNLLYKATVDSDKASAFHNKCDGAKSTIVLVESRNGKRFGGFTSCDWKGNAIEKKDENAFVFSLDKMKAYNIIPGELAIGCYPKFGPVFLGCQIRIYDEAFIKGGTTFEKEKNYETQEDYELTGGLKKFEVKEIEVYSVELE